MRRAALGSCLVLSKGNKLSFCQTFHFSIKKVLLVHEFKGKKIFLWSCFETGSRSVDGVLDKTYDFKYNSEGRKKRLIIVTIGVFKIE